MARHRAAEGIARKKFCRGEPLIDPETGQQYVEREYSDTLLIFLLKGGNPVVFGDRVKVQDNVWLLQHYFTIAAQVAEDETRSKLSS